MTRVDSSQWAKGLRLAPPAAAQLEVFTLAFAAGFLTDTDVYSPGIKDFSRLLVNWCNCNLVEK
jgi:hypothetical protein